MGGVSGGRVWERVVYGSRMCDTLRCVRCLAVHAVWRRSNPCIHRDCKGVGDRRARVLQVVSVTLQAAHSFALQRDRLRPVGSSRAYLHGFQTQALPLELTCSSLPRLAMPNVDRNVCQELTDILDNYVVAPYSVDSADVIILMGKEVVSLPPPGCRLECSTAQVFALHLRPGMKHTSLIHVLRACFLLQMLALPRVVAYQMEIVGDVNRRGRMYPTGTFHLKSGKWLYMWVRLFTHCIETLGCVNDWVKLGVGLLGVAGLGVGRGGGAAAAVVMIFRCCTLVVLLCFDSLCLLLDCCLPSSSLPAAGTGSTLTSTQMRSSCCGASAALQSPWTARCRLTACAST